MLASLSDYSMMSFATSLSFHGCFAQQVGSSLPNFAQLGRPLDAHVRRGPGVLLTPDLRHWHAPPLPPLRRWISALVHLQEPPVLTSRGRRTAFLVVSRNKALRIFTQPARTYGYTDA
jgi:hypothetical protein